MSFDKNFYGSSWFQVDSETYCVDMSLNFSVTDIFEIFVEQMSFNTLKHRIVLFSGWAQSSSNNNSD